MKDFGPDATKAAPVSCANAKSSSGVYIWGFEIGGEFIPVNVGKSNRLNERVLQHYARLRGGEYSVYHSSSVGSICDRRGEAPNPEGDGLLYVPLSPHALVTQFLHPKVQEQVAILLESFRITFGVPEQPCDLAAVERGIADLCGREHLGSTVAMTGPRYDLEHNGDATVIAMVKKKTVDEPGRLRGIGSRAERA
jgi:hypothetical protein